MLEHFFEISYLIKVLNQVTINVIYFETRRFYDYRII